MPDQKRSSKSSNADYAERKKLLRWKIITQDTTDASTRVNITSCTSTLAVEIRCHMDI